MAEEFQINTTIVLSVTFKDATLAFVDPTVSVAVKIKSPDGVIETPLTSTIVHDSLGHYHIEKLVDQEGDWFHYWEGLFTGGKSVTDEQQFRVLRSEFF